jgi:3-oxoacyl-[acyl-carrier-protein] synthase-3
MFELELERPLTFPSHTVRGTAVAGLGVAVPEPVVPNQVVADRLGVTPEWITERTGVRQRHVAPAEKTLVEAATEGGRAALEDAGVDAEAIDLVIVATVTAEMLCPAAAPVVAANLGCDHAGAFDLNAACSGFLSGLGMASAWIATGAAERALVIGCDLMYRVIDHDDRSTAGIFADGGGAVVLAPCSGEGRIGRINLASDGARGDLVEATREEAIVRMNGHDTFRQAVARLCETTLRAVDDAGLTLEEIDLFVYHQANSRIIAAVGEKLGLDPAKVVDCVGEYGNTSAGSLPIALGVARDDGRLKSGSKVLLGVFGGGLTWGAGVVEWGFDEKAASESE